MSILLLSLLILASSPLSSAATWDISVGGDVQTLPVAGAVYGSVNVTGVKTVSGIYITAVPYIGVDGNGNPCTVPPIMFASVINSRPSLANHSWSSVAPTAQASAGYEADLFVPATDLAGGVVYISVNPDISDGVCAQNISVSASAVASITESWPRVLELTQLEILTVSVYQNWALWTDSTFGAVDASLCNPSRFDAYLYTYPNASLAAQLAADSGCLWPQDGAFPGSQIICPAATWVDPSVSNQVLTSYGLNVFAGINGGLGVPWNSVSVLLTAFSSLVHPNLFFPDSSLAAVGYGNDLYLTFAPFNFGLLPNGSQPTNLGTLRYSLTTDLLYPYGNPPPTSALSQLCFVNSGVMDVPITLATADGKDIPFACDLFYGPCSLTLVAPNFYSSRYYNHSAHSNLGLYLQLITPGDVHIPLFAWQPTAAPKAVPLPAPSPAPSPPPCPATHAPAPSVCPSPDHGWPGSAIALFVITLIALVLALAAIAFLIMRQKRASYEVVM